MDNHIWEPILSQESNNSFCGYMQNYSTVSSSNAIIDGKGLDDHNDSSIFPY